MNRYLEQSSKLQWINFFKQRLICRKGVCDADEISLQIFKIFDMIKEDFAKLGKKKRLHQHETLFANAIVSNKDMIEVGMIMNPEEPTR